MEYRPLSPFMRPMSRAHLRLVDEVSDPASAPASAPPPDTPVSKWEVLRNLAKGQTAFGVTERDLTVLQGLLSFHPHEALGNGAGMVVFASNKALCERLNGMACSTMRRHLGRLVEAGLLWRRDSPNGKRYARNAAQGRIAYGLDLTPLHRRAAEIAEAAQAARAAEEQIRSLREVVSLMRRDLSALADLGTAEHPEMPGLWDQLRDAATLTARALRRKLGAEDLEAIRTRLGPLIKAGRSPLEPAPTEVSGTNDSQSGQHYQNSDIDILESEAAWENAARTPAQEPKAQAPGEQKGKEQQQADTAAERPPDKTLQKPCTSAPCPAPRVDLSLVLESCPELRTFYTDQIRHWTDLHSAATRLGPAMGISTSAWTEAQQSMGPEQASIVLVAMLERFAEIRSPGGYLRALSAKAARGEFTCAPMVRALAARRRAA